MCAQYWSIHGSKMFQVFPIFHYGTYRTPVLTCSCLMLPALKEELCDFATKASKRDLRLEEFYIFHHISTFLVSWCRGHVLSPSPFHLYINKNSVHLKCHDPDHFLQLCVHSNYCATQVRFLPTSMCSYFPNNADSMHEHITVYHQSTRHHDKTIQLNNTT
jgi:hypothetical protein